MNVTDKTYDPTGELNKTNPETGPFSRIDETDDSIFYSRPRMVKHLDSEALAVVTKIISTLVVEKDPAVLDLMASWDSHLPKDLQPARVVGLGMNQRELEANPRLTERVIHDLNADPTLPFPDESFDVVLNTVSVDYLTHPVEVFAEAARVLKPGGMLLVLFSNRWFPQKVVRAWKEASEDERIIMVEEFFNLTEAFEPTRLTMVMGRPRPPGDKYAERGLPSDPIFAVYADRKGANVKRQRPEPELDFGKKPSQAELDRRLKEVPQTHRCPYCGEKLKKWAAPESPFWEWNTDHMYICFNDSCGYLVRGFAQMAKQGNWGMSYRLMFNPLNNCCQPASVMSLTTLKDGIVEDDDD